MNVQSFFNLIHFFLTSSQIMNSERCFLNPSQNDSVLPSRPFTKETHQRRPFVFRGRAAQLPFITRSGDLAAVTGVYQLLL